MDISSHVNWDSIHDASYSLGLNLNISIFMVFSWAVNKDEKHKEKPILSQMMKSSFDFYQGLSITKHSR